MFEEVTEDLEEDDEAGDPEAGEEGVVDDVEHSDLEPGERGSAEEICKFNLLVHLDLPLYFRLHLVRMVPLSGSKSMYLKASHPVRSQPTWGMVLQI